MPTPARLRLDTWAPIALAALGAACAGPPPPAKAPPQDPGLIELATEATTDLVLADAPADLAIRVRVSAGRLPGGQRPPLNLVLVIDTSGSMIGAPIAHARDAARELVGHLTASDRFAVVAFHSSAEVVVPSLPGTALQRLCADWELAHLQARGTTDLAGGLALGLAQLELGRQPGSIDRVVLVGDGIANEPGPIPALIAQARAMRAAVTTLGLGIEYDEEQLARIALDTGGSFHFVKDAAAVATLFDDELLKMREVVARNVVLGLQPGPGVALQPVPGVEFDGSRLVVHLGDLAAGEVRDVIIPLTAAPRRHDAAVELVDATLTYDDAVNASGAQVRRGYVAARASSDAVAVASAVKLPLEAARRRAEAASAILEAIRMARAGDVAGGLARLTDAEAAARTTATATGDAELTALAARMAELKLSLAQVAVVHLGEDRPTATARHARGAASAAEALDEPMIAPVMAAPRAVAPEAAEQQLREIQAEANHALRH